jgi:hypothetical protein
MKIHHSLRCKLWFKNVICDFRMLIAELREMKQEANISTLD